MRMCWHGHASSGWSYCGKLRSQHRLWPDPVSGPPTKLNESRLQLAQCIHARRGTEIEEKTERYILGALDDWKPVV